MSDTTNMWATVSTKDNLIYEGVVYDEVSYGIYLYIGGDPERISLFPWGSVNRVTYKR